MKLYNFIAVLHALTNKFFMSGGCFIEDTGKYFTKAQIKTEEKGNDA